MTCVGGKRKKDPITNKVNLAEAKKTWTPEQLYRATRTNVITDAELEEALTNADNIENEYFRLRAKAVISLARLSGKRRGELAIIPLDNFKLKAPHLEVTFILEKKRKGAVINKVATKLFSLTDPLTANVLEYLAYLEKLKVKPQYWLPSGKMIFGSYAMYIDTPVTGRTVFNIIRDCTEKIWPHLNRETVAADVIQKDQSLTAVFKIAETLDLESFTTAFNYVKRFSKHLIERQSVT